MQAAEYGRACFWNFNPVYGMRKINAIDLKQANKVMHLSAIAYNLKKYLKFEQKRSKSRAGKLAFILNLKSMFQNLFLGLLRKQNTSLVY